MFLGMPPCVVLNEAISVGNDLFELASGVLNYDIERFAYAGNSSPYRGPATRWAVDSHSVSNYFHSVLNSTIGLSRPIGNPYSGFNARRTDEVPP